MEEVKVKSGATVYGIAFVFSLAILLTHFIYNSIEDVYWQLASVYCVLVIIIFIIGVFATFNTRHS